MKVSNEIKIGIMVTAVVFLLLLLTFRVGNFEFVQRGYEIKVRFNRIEGLEANAPVRLNGLEVGSIKNIQLLYEPQTTMELVLWLKQEARLREGAQASINVMGLIGEKYVELTSGNKDGAFLEPGSLIIGNDPIDFEKLMAKGDVLVDNLMNISTNINERLKVNSQAIDEILANMRTITSNLTSITSNVNERLTLNRQHIDDIVIHLNATSQNLEELSSDLKVNPWKLLYKGKDKNKSP